VGERGELLVRRGATIGIVIALASAGFVAGAAKQPAAKPPLNVILISLDTVRPEHLSCYGYHRETTPNIDAIAKEGVIFTQAFAQAPQTFPSHLSIFTSSYPKQPWLSWDSAEIDPSVATLTELMKSQGYATAAFTGIGDPGSPHEAILESRAFQPFDRIEQAWLSSILSTTLSAWLEEHRQKPFFLFVHGFDAHEPHVVDADYGGVLFDPDYTGQVPSTLEELDALRSKAPAPREAQDGGQEPRVSRKREEAYLQFFKSPEGPRAEDVTHMRALYDSQLYGIDEGLGRFFARLRELGLMERTILVIFSDHGQAFGEHGTYASHWKLYDEVIRIALIIRDPRLKHEGEIDSIVQGIDIMPTILELLGISAPKSTQGRSLAALLREGKDPGRSPRTVSIGQGMRAIRTPHWKLIVHADRPDELYRLAEDPSEIQNLLERHPELAEQLKRQLDAVVTQEAAGPAEDPDVWAEERGYW
jgi:arylsulfatase A-like enzyme